MSSPADGCDRPPSIRGARGDAAPLAVGTPDPVLCTECGNVFGGGAEVGTVCPYCMGSLHPLPAAREALDGAPLGIDSSMGGAE